LKRTLSRKKKGVIYVPKAEKVMEEDRGKKALVHLGKKRSCGPICNAKLHQTMTLQKRGSSLINEF